MSSNKQPGLPTEVSYNEAVEASKKYFDGDDLAATVWVSKYALKLVVNRTSRLDNGGDTGFVGNFHTVGKREKRIRSHNSAIQVEIE